LFFSVLLLVVAIFMYSTEDQDLQRAISMSLAEHQRTVSKQDEAPFPSIYQLVHCGRTLFFLTPPNGCLFCGQRVEVEQNRHSVGTQANSLSLSQSQAVSEKGNDEGATRVEDNTNHSNESNSTMETESNKEAKEKDDKSDTAGSTVENKEKSHTNKKLGEEAEASHSNTTPLNVTVYNSGVGPTRPRCIVVRPTIGSFHTYNNQMLLHCGISNSKGKVYNFDIGGCSAEEWKLSLSINLAHPCSDSEWDAQLERHNNAEKSFLAYRPYQALRNNCYDYVIRFLNGIKFEGKEDHKKEDVVARLIQTPIGHFENFFEILRKVKQREPFEFILPNPATTKARVAHVCDACGQIIPVNAFRFRCLECEDYDLCEGCQKARVETEQHKRSHSCYKIKEGQEYTCNVCGGNITGPCYHCLVCVDYDLCEGCKNAQKANASHKLHHKMAVLT
jgi:hypothetical protein